jgi:hypothetical protein
MCHPLIALLKGGPENLPRVWETPPGGTDERVKIPCGNGYEHFEFTQEYADVGCRSMPVYRWVYRTAIAE